MASSSAARIAQYGHCPSTILSAPAVLPAPTRLRSALHVGAGLDARALRLLPDVQRFVLVDSKPFGIDASDPAFLPRLHEGMYREGFTSMSSSSAPALLAHIHGSPGIHRFRSANGRIAEYHYNTCLPGATHPLLPRCDTVVVTAHDPHASIVTQACVAHNLHFVGFHGAAYTQRDPETTIGGLHTSQAFRDRFASFAYVDEENRATPVATWDAFQALVSEATLRGAST